MGQAKFFKQLRKLANYSWISVADRKYRADQNGLKLATGTRVEYRKLKKLAKEA